VTLHVIEASDPARAIVDYARKNQVDHIVIGARSSGGLRRLSRQRVGASRGRGPLQTSPWCATRRRAAADLAPIFRASVRF
jgi:K+-sensing histidine kinase KdpD